MSELLLKSNENLDDPVDDQIAGFLNPAKPRCFFLFAGAGSGKTRSLVKALNNIRNAHGHQLAFRGQRVGVITYTNAACDEIKSRIDFNPLFYVSTIHSFAWELIKYFNHDIREWLRSNLQLDIENLEKEEAKGRLGTKASIIRQSQIESKFRRLERLDTIRGFTYNPNGDNREQNSLNHSEVIEICADFIANKPLMKWILVGRFPFLLIDESQDTNKRLVDAFFMTALAHEQRFCLGLIGDVMQRIYADGKEKIEENLPASWAKPSKQLNHRCPKRVVTLINKIRATVDTHVQIPRTDAIEGNVCLFIRHADTADRNNLEEIIRERMAERTADENWRERDACKSLTLEHHMAAKRLGFDRVFDPIYAIESWRTGLLDGSLPTTRFFVKDILPLVEAQKANDRFEIARIVRSNSPLLTPQALKEAPDVGDLLRKAQFGVDALASLWKEGEPTCGQVLKCVAENELFNVPDGLKPVLQVFKTDSAAKPDEAEAADPATPEASALISFLGAPFGEIDLYRRYVSGLASFDTHQGVKGLEFDRVMVIMDDAEARGFLFGYEKLLGAKAQSATDLKNASEGKDTGIDRTRRLFYVTCSRAEKSLALVAYTEDPNAVKRHVLKNKWFAEDEIDLEM